MSSYDVMYIVDKNFRDILLVTCDICRTSYLELILKNSSFDVDIIHISTFLENLNRYQNYLILLPDILFDIVDINLNNGIKLNNIVLVSTSMNSNWKHNFQSDGLKIQAQINTLQTNQRMIRQILEQCRLS